MLWLILGVILSLLLEAEHLPQAAADVVGLLDENFETFFFGGLLPPIIFRSGWALAAGLDGLGLADLLTHIRPALILAFVGTIVCSVCTAGWFFAFSAAGAIYPFTWLQSLTLAVALSATDTVCVLSLLRELKVQSNLYATIFGESILNDAVTIVLFRALTVFINPATTATPTATANALGYAVLDFLWGFVGSSLIGALIGVAITALFKFGRLGSTQMRLGTSTDVQEASARQAMGLDVERGVLALAPFLSFMCAEASGSSGVVSAMFCGCIIASLAQRNVHPTSAVFSGQLYHTAGSLAEYLTFLFLGVACTEMGSPAFSKHWPAAVVLLVGCALGRAVSVACCVWLVNFRLPASDPQRIDRRMAVVVWFSGLRGGVAFALATVAGNHWADPEIRAALPVCAIFVAAVTLPAISLGTSPLVRYLGLKGLQQNELDPAEAPAVATSGRGVARGRVGGMQAMLLGWAEKAYLLLVVQEEQDPTALLASSGYVAATDPRRLSSRLSQTLSPSSLISASMGLSQHALLAVSAINNRGDRSASCVSTGASAAVALRGGEVDLGVGAKAISAGHVAARGTSGVREDEESDKDDLLAAMR